MLNSLSGVGLFVVNAVIALIMTPVLVHELGNRDYGIWELLVALVGYLGVLDLGVGPALVRYVADAWSRQDRDQLSAIFNSAFVGLCGVGVVGLGLMALASIWPERLFAIGAGEAAALTPVFLLFGLNFFLYMPRTAFSAYLLGMQAHRFVNGIQMIVSIAMAVVWYAILVGEVADTLAWLAIVLLAGTFVQVVALMLWILVVDRRVRFRPGSFDRKTLGDLVRFGVKSTMMSASTGLLNKLVGFAIVYTVGVAHVVFFVVSNRLVEYARALGMQLGFPLTPHFADLRGRSGVSAVGGAWLQTTRLLQAIMFFSPVALYALGVPFVGVWLGPEYAENARWVLYVLCSGLVFNALVANDARVLISANRHGPIAVYAAALAPVCFGLSIVLGMFSGIVGVAVAVTLYSIGHTILSLYLTCRLLEVSVLDYLRQTAFRYVIPVAVASGVFVALRRVAYPADYLLIATHGAAAGVFYCVSVWLFGLAADERTWVKRKFGAWRQAPAA